MSQWHNDEDVFDADQHAEGEEQFARLTTSERARKVHFVLTAEFIKSPVAPQKKSKAMWEWPVAEEEEEEKELQTNSQAPPEAKVQAAMWEWPTEEEELDIQTEQKTNTNVLQVQTSETNTQKAMWEWPVQVEEEEDTTQEQNNASQQISAQSPLGTLEGDMGNDAGGVLPNTLPSAESPSSVRGTTSMADSHISPDGQKLSPLNSGQLTPLSPWSPPVRMTTGMDEASPSWDRQRISPVFCRSVTLPSHQSLLTRRRPGGDAHSPTSPGTCKGHFGASEAQCFNDRNSMALADQMP